MVTRMAESAAEVVVTRRWAKVVAKAGTNNEKGTAGRKKGQALAQVQVQQVRFAGRQDAATLERLNAPLHLP